MITHMRKEEFLEQREVAYTMKKENEAARNLAILEALIAAWMLGYQHRGKVEHPDRVEDTNTPNLIVTYNHIVYELAVEHPILGNLPIREIKTLWNKAMERTTYEFIVGTSPFND